MILHELYDDSDVVGVVLDGDDSHNVGRVLGVRILTVLVGQDKASIGLMNLGIYIQNYFYYISFLVIFKKYF